MSLYDKALDELNDTLNDYDTYEDDMTHDDMTQWIVEWDTQDMDDDTVYPDTTQYAPSLLDIDDVADWITDTTGFCIVELSVCN